MLRMRGSVEITMIYEYVFHYISNWQLQMPMQSAIANAIERIRCVNYVYIYIYMVWLLRNARTK